ncbi:MAG: GNAT family N-acetyltransferase [Gammaproteobacteria bacterium]|nr:MAG: GNAT family N-acetyltransferase [Gammaproteobacteria bacterium]|tara:strand:+ start:142 stop:714 length:573 start_codon:yes stop_codon:yes gene_type:complete
MTGIKNLLQEEQASAVNTLLLAFSSDPFQRYLMPDSSIFLKNSAIWFNNAASQSISIDGLLGTEDYSGVAAWFPPDYIIEFKAIEETLKDLPDNSQKDIFKYFKQFEENRPKDAWYLEYLGVDPSKHSMGLGSLLLKKSLEKIDNLHQSAYLESSNPKNMTLYERHGFETVSKIQFGEGPPMHTMFREAR